MLSWLIAQVSPESSALIEALTQFGIAAPVVGVLYYWGRSQQKRADDAQEARVDEIKATLGAMISSTGALNDVTKAVAALTVQVQSTTLDARLVRRLEEHIDRDERGQAGRPPP